MTVWCRLLCHSNTQDFNKYFNHHGYFNELDTTMARGLNLICPSYINLHNWMHYEDLWGNVINWIMCSQDMQGPFWRCSTCSGLCGLKKCNMQCCSCKIWQTFGEGRSWVPSICFDPIQLHSNPFKYIIHSANLPLHGCCQELIDFGHGRLWGVMNVWCLSLWNPPAFFARTFWPQNCEVWV